MTEIDRLAEQHMREYQTRSRNLDELIEKARARLTESPEHEPERKELAGVLAERDRLRERMDEQRLSSVDNWREEEIERSSLMGVWDALAQQLEKLVERLER